MEEKKIVIYQTEDGQTQIDVRLENDTVWLTQAQMAELFQKDQSVVARHLNNAIKEGELEKSNMQILHNTLYKYRPTKVYDLDAIILVGYRVKSKRGVILLISSSDSSIIMKLLYLSIPFSPTLLSYASLHHALF